MKVPFPNISSGLAVKSHMYICGHSSSPDYGFIKVQTLKPYMIGSNLFKHYVDEKADISRNPFYHTSRIDCDKLFTSASAVYDDCLKTTLRPDICQSLYDNVLNELLSDGYKNIKMNESELVLLNSSIH